MVDVTVTLHVRLRRGARTFLLLANAARAILGLRSDWVPRWVVSVKVKCNAA
jgi:hypothetical protein